MAKQSSQDNEHSQQIHVSKRKSKIVVHNYNLTAKSQEQNNILQIHRPPQANVLPMAFLLSIRNHPKLMC